MSVNELKKSLRKKAQRTRASQGDKDKLSLQILSNLGDLASFQRSHTVLLYLSHSSEVRTILELDTFLQMGKRILVPYCEGNSLQTFWLKNRDELEEGEFGILEPSVEWRRVKERKVSNDEIDLIIVPGLAFDRNGGRLGYGRGYYDRFLSQVRLDCALVGLAFECQIVREVPMSEHDMPLDVVITEAGVYAQENRQEESL